MILAKLDVVVAAAAVGAAGSEASVAARRAAHMVTRLILGASFSTFFAF